MSSQRVVSMGRRTDRHMSPMRRRSLGAPECFRCWRATRGLSSPQGGSGSGRSIAKGRHCLAAWQHWVLKSPGRWCPEGSDVYVRTYNSIVKKMHKKIVAVLRSETAYEELDEGAIMEELKVWLHEKWTVPEDQANDVVEAWKEKIGAKGLRGKPVVVSDDDTTIYGDSQSEKDGGTQVEKDPKRRKMSEALEEEREGGYVVVYRRAGQGTLHRLGSKGCWIAKRRFFVRAETHQDLPEPEEYTLRCKLCWSGGDEQLSESTSDSQDELGLSD